MHWSISFYLLGNQVLVVFVFATLCSADCDLVGSMNLRVGSVAMLSSRVFVTCQICEPTYLKASEFELPHPIISALSATRLAQKNTFHRLNRPRGKEHMDVSQVLKDTGIAVMGHIDSDLVENVSKYSQSSTTKQWRYQRQTELEWNGDCDAVFDLFETVSRQRTPTDFLSLF